MLATLLGRGGFRKGMDLYFERHDGEATTIEALHPGASRTPTASTCRSSSSGTCRPARRRSPSPAATTRRRRPTGSTSRRRVPPTPGQPDKQPLVIPVEFGLIGPNGARPALALDDGRPVVRGVLDADASRRTRFDVQGRREAAGAVAVPRLLGAGEGHVEHLRARTCCSSPRTTAIRSTAGRRCRRWPTRCSSRTSRRSAPAGTTRDDEGLMRRARGDPGRQQRSSRPSWRWCSRCRARPTSRATSAATSIPTRSSPPARALRATIGRGSAPALRETYRAHAGRRALQPGCRGAGRRALKNACLDLLAAGGTSAIALAARQYHQADNMTDRMAALGDAVAACACRNARPRSTISIARYPRRSAGHRQVAGAAGRDPGSRDARPRPRADDAPGLLAHQPQPRARADRRLRAGQPDPVQPRRRRRLRFPRRHRAGARRQEPAGRRPAADGVPLLARARSPDGARTPRRRCGASRPRRACRAISTTSSRVRSRRTESARRIHRWHRRLVASATLCANRASRINRA